MTQQLRLSSSEYAAIRARNGAPTVPMPDAPKNKYRNIETVVDGIIFPSRKQAKRYRGLLLLQQKGEITDLALEQAYSIDVNGIHICDYRADFTFRRDGKIVVEDTKGIRTPAFKLKALLMKAVYGVEVVES